MGVGAATGARGVNWRGTEGTRGGLRSAAMAVHTMMNGVFTALGVFVPAAFISGLPIEASQRRTGAWTLE